VIYNGRLIAQFSSNLEEIKNQENNSIKLSDLINMGLSVDKLVELELGRDASRHGGFFYEPVTASLSNAFRVYVENGGGPDIIPHILKLPDDRRKASLLFSVCSSSRKRIEAVEKYIINVPEIAVKYADIVIRDRWPEMEKLNNVNVAELNEQDIDGIRWYMYTYMNGSWPEAEMMLRGHHDEPVYTKLFIDRRELAKFDFLVKGNGHSYPPTESCVYIAGCIMHYDAEEGLYPTVEIIKIMSDKPIDPKNEHHVLLSCMREAVVYIKSKVEIDHDGVLYTWDMPYGSTYNGRI
jgi:hypothetical protein